MYVRGLLAATGNELMLDQRGRYGSMFVKRIKLWRYLLRESMHEGGQVVRDMVDVGKTVGLPK